MKRKVNAENCGQEMPQKEADPDTADTVSGSCGFTWFKLRFFFCAVLFSAFALCDKLDYPFFNLDTEIVYEKIQQNNHYTNIKKYVMMMADDENQNVEKE
ncbi:MAG: hypothetical protein ACI4DO_01975 [Roseburia sp.]